MVSAKVVAVDAKADCSFKLKRKIVQMLKMFKQVTEATKLLYNRLYKRYSKCGRIYQKQKLKVKVWCLCTGIATFRDYTTTVGPETSKSIKMMPFSSHLIVGTRTPQILNDGASCHYRWLAEGLVHWNSLDF